MNVLYIVLTFLLSFVLVFIFIPSILNVSHSKKLYVEPGGRMVHKNSVPTLGGVAIFFGILIVYSLYVEITGKIIVPFLVPSLLVIFFIGVKDDILVTAPVVKLMGQIVAASIVVVAGDIRFTSLYGVLPIDLAYPLSIFLTIGFVVFLVNGVNLIDGVDGLASIIGIIIISAFSIWFFVNNLFSMVFLGVSIIGALLAFLYYNFQRGKRKIFMGDTGSLILGFLVAVFTIRFLEANTASLASHLLMPVSSMAGVALSVIILPVTDTIRVFVRRIMQGRSPFSADKNHVHHRLLSLGFSHLQVVTILGIVNIAFIIFSFFLRNMDPFSLMLLNLSLGFLLLQVPSLAIRYKKRSLRLHGKAA